MYPKTTFGSFSEDGRVYRITDPYSPRKLYNVLYSDDDYHAMVSQYGTGSGGVKIPGGHENVILSESGPNKTLYCRDESTHDVWTPGVFPMNSPLEDYSCEHHDACRDGPDPLPGRMHRRTAGRCTPTPSLLSECTVSFLASPSCLLRLGNLLFERPRLVQSTGSAVMQNAPGRGLLPK